MTNKNELTARENEVLALAWQCCESEPKIDYNKLATRTGYTTGSAKVTMGNIKRKIKAMRESDSQDSPTPKKTKRAAPAAQTPTKRQKKKVQQPVPSNNAGGSDEDEVDLEGLDQLGVKKEEPEHEEDDDDFLAGINEAAGY